jgi:hypothetical protein
MPMHFLQFPHNFLTFFMALRSDLIFKRGDLPNLTSLSINLWLGIKHGREEK